MIPIVYVYIPINTGGTVCPGSGSPRSPTHGHGSMGGVRVSWYPLPPCQRSINILGTRWKEHEHPHPAPPHVSVASTSCARSRERGRWNVNIPTPPHPAPCERGAGAILLCRFQKMSYSHFSSDVWR